MKKNIFVLFCVAFLSTVSFAQSASFPCPNFEGTEIPNVFSPNNDGNNDVFYLEGWDNCIETFNLLIYDRWGVKIFESTNVNVEWDGRLLSGTEAVGGTYYYIFNIKNTNGEAENLAGFITLVR